MLRTDNRRPNFGYFDGVAKNSLVHNASAHVISAARETAVTITFLFWNIIAEAMGRISQLVLLPPHVEKREPGICDKPLTEELRLAILKDKRFNLRARVPTQSDSNLLTGASSTSALMASSRPLTRSQTTFNLKQLDL